MTYVPTLYKIKDLLSPYEASELHFFFLGGEGEDLIGDYLALTSLSTDEKALDSCTSTSQSVSFFSASQLVDFMQG